MIQADTPEQLLTNIATACAVIIDYSAEAGFRVNLSAGKTEVVLFLQGTGSRSRKIKAHIADQGKINLVSKYIGPLEVRAVVKYPHLGTLITENGQIGPEIA